MISKPNSFHNWQYDRASLRTTGLICSGQSLLKAALLVALYMALLSSGVFSEMGDWVLTAFEGWLVEPLLISVAQAIPTDTLFTGGLLFGLCWLLFQFSPPRRAGVFLKKFAFAFREATTLQPASEAHGCRAPPL